MRSGAYQASRNAALKIARALYSRCGRSDIAPFDGDLNGADRCQSGDGCLICFRCRGTDRSFDGAHSLYEQNGKSYADGKHPYWSWSHVTASDIQTNSVTRLEQVKQVEGVYSSGANDPTMYDNFLTQSAIQRLGASWSHEAGRTGCGSTRTRRSVR